MQENSQLEKVMNWALSRLRLRTSFLAGIFILSISCGEIEKKASNSSYFDINPYLSNQIELLTQKDISLRKVLSFDSDLSSETDTVNINHLQDSSAWAKELEIFEDLNLNQSKLQGLYSVEEQPDTESNLTIRTFTLKGEKGSIPELKIYYLKEADQPLRMEARYRDENVGFTSARNYQLFWKELEGDLVMDHFLITGSQKVIGQDSIIFKTESKFIYPLQ